jgi:S1-C subfamily serine protease
MASQAARAVFLLGVALSTLTAGCAADSPRVASLETAVTSQGQQLELLARTPTPLPTPRATATASPTPTTTPSPTPSPSPSPQATPTPTLASMLRSVLPSVVRVTTNDAVGTGFVVWESGRVLTAYHVVKSDPSHVVLLTIDGVQQKATVIAADEYRDLALLEARGLNAPPLPIVVESTLGDPVVVVGYQNALPGGASVTRGIVSATRLNPSGVGVLQTDAAINHGASGGPVLSELGQVLGLVSYGISVDGTPLEGLGFAVAAREIERFRGDFEAGRLGPPVAPTRTPTRTPRSG